MDRASPSGCSRPLAHLNAGGFRCTFRNVFSVLSMYRIVLFLPITAYAFGAPVQSRIHDMCPYGMSPVALIIGRLESDVSVCVCVERGLSSIASQVDSRPSIISSDLDQLRAEPLSSFSPHSTGPINDSRMR